MWSARKLIPIHEHTMIIKEKVRWPKGSTVCLFQVTKQKERHDNFDRWEENGGMLASLLALTRIELAKFYSRYPTSRCRLSHDGEESDVQVGNV